MMQIDYITNDGSMRISLQDISKRKLHMYPGVGKSYPRHTQCLVFVNGLLVGFAEVVKHHKDIDNMIFATKLVTKKAIVFINLKDVRQILWDKVLCELKKPCYTTNTDQNALKM